MNKEFCPYQPSLDMKSIGFDEPCFCIWNRERKLRFNNLHNPSDRNKNIKLSNNNGRYPAPTFSQAINFLYVCSNKQIDIELKGSDTYEERIRKIEQGCKDLWNLQNNKSNQ